jgi:MFS family permease
MYLADVHKTQEPRPAARGGRLLTGNVLALGMVSLLTDVSSEMVTAVFPVYLVLVLGLSPLQFGVIDGLYTGATALLRLVGGHIADRFRRRKLVAGTGYGLSAAAKLGLLGAGQSVPFLSAVLAVDRAGKGLRTAPRDAMISLSVPADRQGRAFGLHRALDTTGALLGPIAAFGVLWLTVDDFAAVFVVSACVAALGVVVLALFVREPAGLAGAERRASIRGVVALLRRRRFRYVVLAILPLSLVTISDSFLYLLVQQRLRLDAGWLPLLPVVVSGAYLLAAAPFGRLADRVGRGRMVLVGYAGVLVCYLPLLVDGLAGPLGPGIVLLVRGLAYAATDGVVSALVAPLVPPAQRATGLAVVQTGQALAAMAAAWTFGALWTAFGPETAVGAMASGMAVLLVGAAVLLRLGRRG